MFVLNFKILDALVPEIFDTNFPMPYTGVSDEKKRKEVKRRQKKF